MRQLRTPRSGPEERARADGLPNRRAAPVRAAMTPGGPRRRAVVSVSRFICRSSGACCTTPKPSSLSAALGSMASGCSLNGVMGSRISRLGALSCRATFEPAPGPVQESVSRRKHSRRTGNAHMAPLLSAGIRSPATDLLFFGSANRQSEDGLRGS
jgi:hypothetical protein